MPELCDSPVTNIGSICGRPAKWALSYWDINKVLYRCAIPGTNLNGLATAVHLPTGKSYSESELREYIRNN